MSPPMGNHSTANGVVQTAGARILCVADVRGKLSLINAMAKRVDAQYVIHTGDFGFYDDESLDRMNEKTLKHVIQYSPLVPRNMGAQFAGSNSHEHLKASIKKHSEPILSELPLFLNKTLAFDVPVYTTWGACEDVRVLEKFRSAEYHVDNLHIVDEHDSRLLEVGGLKLRLLGLGGAVVMHKLFDNGEGRTTIAGGQGTMWTTVLQMGELIETALATFDRSETRIFVSHMSPGREGLLAQLALALRADFTISAGLHFRYGTSYNDFSVNPNLDHFRNRLAASRTSFSDVWETVKPEVLPIVQAPQKKLIDNVLQIIEMATSGERGSTDEVGFKNLWNFNLPDATFGSLILDIKDGQVASEQRSEGFNFDYRRAERRVKPVTSQPVEQHASQIPLPSVTSSEKVAAPPPSKDVVAPPAVKPPTPPPPAADDGSTPSVSTAEPTATTTSTITRGWGRPTAQIWIGSPPMEEVKDMFPQPHKDKIKHVRKANARGSNHPYAIVYFNSIEEAQAAIESLTHPKIKFGDDFDHDRTGSYGPRGGGSFGGGSYPDRKSGGSDSEMNRGGFGRGGRGGRGGPGSRGGGGPGSSGTYSSRGSGSHSPAPGRGGSSARGRGGAPPQHQPKDDTNTDSTKEVDTTHSEATEAKPADSPTTTPSQPLPSSTQTSTAAAAPAAVSLDSQTESASC